MQPVTDEPKRNAAGQLCLPFRRTDVADRVTVIPIGPGFPDVEDRIRRGWVPLAWAEYDMWILAHRPNAPLIGESDPVALAIAATQPLPPIVPPEAAKEAVQPWNVRHLAAAAEKESRRRAPWTNDRWLEPRHLTTFSMTGHPAFVLGNAPDLPVDDLHLLDEFLTIGTNRVIQLYDPTLLMFCDISVWRDIASAYQTTACQAITSGDFLPAEVLTTGQFHHTKPIWQITIGRDETGRSRDIHIPDNPGYIIIDGNTGVGAACWALSLGCSPVYLLGMSATYDGRHTNHPRIKYGFFRAQGHQYGINPYHDAAREPGAPMRGDTLAVMRRKLQWLLREEPDNAIPISTGEALKDVIARHTGMGRQWYIEQFLKHAENANVPNDGV